MTDHGFPTGSDLSGLPQPPLSVVPSARNAVFAPSFFRAVLCGLGGASAGAAVWYAFVAFSDSQFVFGAVGLGLAVGYSVSWGAGRGGVAPAALSAVIASLAVAGAYYYINRHLLIAGAQELGSSYDIPLRPTFEELKIVLRVGYEADDRQYVFSGLCIAAAAFFGFKGSPTSRGDAGGQVARR